MATVYINLYKTPGNDPVLPNSLFNSRYEVECLKWLGPDDGEAINSQGKYCVRCPDDEWIAVIDKLEESGMSLFYSVVLRSPDGDVIVPATGELNAAVKHYSNHFKTGIQALAFWFGDFLHRQMMMIS
ncbi:MAG: hypothetical protein PHE55_22625 [Methylococcaceae bacterium]|nr:hypothetical protein [Methylococcaceae bacterium]